MEGDQRLVSQTDDFDRRVPRGTGARLVIFDCDGVLVDSELISARVLLEDMSRIGFRADLAYFFQNCLGRHFSAVAARIAADSGRAVGADFEMEYRARLLEAFSAELKPMPGAREVLSRMKTSYCVATNSKTLRATRTFEFAGLSELVEGRIFSGSMVERGKPAPDLFLLAAARHDVPAEHCLVIEDSDMGIAAAHAACMPVWRFTGGSHYRSPHGSPSRQLSVDWEFDDLRDFHRLWADLS